MATRERKSRSRSPPPRSSRSSGPRERSRSKSNSRSRSRSPPRRREERSPIRSKNKYPSRRDGDDRKSGKDDEWQRLFGKGRERHLAGNYGDGSRGGPRRAPNPFLSEAKSAEHQWGKKADDEEKEDKSKTARNFGTSGALTKDLRTDERSGVELKYLEPTEARVPKVKWRLYPFKNEQSLEPYPLSRRSFYLLGRDRQVAHVPLDHPSCSKQHAVIQFRAVRVDDDESGQERAVVKPYLMDLGSVNGTFLNGVKVEDSRYIELLEKDQLRFGLSTREYILLHEASQ